MDKQQELVDKYPHLFEHAYPSIGSGWLPILEALCYMLEQYTNWEGQNDEPFSFSQIKEKFGAGRIYYDGGSDYTRGLVDMAEAMTARTCEECGAAGTTRRMSWVRTLCDSCHSDWDNIRQAKWDRLDIASEESEEGCSICDVCGRNTKEYDMIVTTNLAGVIVCSGEMKETCKRKPYPWEDARRDLMPGDVTEEEDAETLAKVYGWDGNAD
jgi:hypothetical protein